MSVKDQGRSHNWKRRIKDWLIVPQTGTYANPHPVTHQELAQHHTRLDCWMAIDGVVYDVSRFVPYHPGGTKILEMYAGRDATAAFVRNHATSNVLQAIPSCLVGKLVEDSSAGAATPPEPPIATSASTASSVSQAPPPYTLDPTTGKQPVSHGSERPAPTASPSTDALSAMPEGHAQKRVSELEAELAAGVTIGLTKQQLVAIANKSQLFSDVASDVLATTVDEAVSAQARGEIDDETALRELFGLLDKGSKGYITRAALRDFLYQLEPEGVAEESLLRAPDQVTLPVFLKLLKQL